MNMTRFDAGLAIVLLVAVFALVPSIVERYKSEEPLYIDKNIKWQTIT